MTNLPINANLSILVRPPAIRVAGEEAAVAGGSDQVERQAVTMLRAKIQEMGGEIQLLFEPGYSAEDAANPLNMLKDTMPLSCVSLAIPPLELPVDWTGYGHLEIELLAPESDENIDLTLIGTRSRLAVQTLCQQGKPTKLRLDLTDLPLIQGIRPSRQPQTIRLTPIRRSGGTCTIHLRKLGLIPLEEKKHPPVIDEYGQRIHAQWPGKITRDSDLTLSLRDEIQAMAEISLPQNRSIWGGMNNGPRFPATGYFRVQQDDAKRWWLVDPDGWPFWSYGPTCVRWRDETKTTGREDLFANLPPRTDPLWISDTQISFYLANCLKKYGSIDGWRDHTLERLLHWGANTLGNWSSPQVMDAQTIPTTRDMGSPIAGTEISRGFCDVFHPDWFQGFRERCEREAAPYKDDPWTIGWFVDNEKPWLHPNLLSAPKHFPIRQVFLELVQTRYADVQDFNQATACNCADWQAVAELNEESLGTSAAAEALRLDLLRIYAEKYFSTIADLLRQIVPNHLYLGCRFVRNMPDPEVVRISAKYCDVMTVNCYSLFPIKEQFDTWYATCGRPILIGEHQLALSGDPRMLPPPWHAATRQERGDLELQFNRIAAQFPYCVGCHWFQYVDQVGTGRSSNGENMLIGWVDVTDQIHPEMIAAARKIGASMYEWHAKS